MSEITNNLGMAMHMVATKQADEVKITFAHKRDGDFEIIVRRPKKKATGARGKE